MDMYAKQTIRLARLLYAALASLQANIKKVKALECTNSVLSCH